MTQMNNEYSFWRFNSMFLNELSHSLLWFKTFWNNKHFLLFVRRAACYPISLDSTIFFHSHSYCTLQILLSGIPDSDDFSYSDRILMAFCKHLYISILKNYQIDVYHHLIQAPKIYMHLVKAQYPIHWCIVAHFSISLFFLFSSPLLLWLHFMKLVEWEAARVFFSVSFWFGLICGEIVCRVYSITTSLVVQNLYISAIP